MTLNIQNLENGKGIPTLLNGVVFRSPRQSQFSKEKEELLVRIAIQIVAMANGLRPEEITQPCRGTSNVSKARQIACYLLHTSLSLSLVDISSYFQKDRTTIGHACRLVEDWRDEPKFDDELIELEKTVLLLRNLAMENLEGVASE